ncbi:MAG: hypothetical protein GX605_14345, partial [Chloroflexi bacterium]|nr:hypothetical protein [Chloroflexota bacterium]
ETLGYVVDYLEEYAERERLNHLSDGDPDSGYMKYIFAADELCRLGEQADGACLDDVFENEDGFLERRACATCYWRGSFYNCPGAEECRI